jgi:hypothetical protein
MERLTKKHDGSGSYTQFGDKYIPNHNIRHKQCVEKLGKLEDIEEELGIPLEVLFKALKEGVWVKEDMWNNNYKIINSGYVINEYCIYNNDFARSTKDYGETWALTKEELE